MPATAGLFSLLALSSGDRSSVEADTNLVTPRARGMRSDWPVTARRRRGGDRAVKSVMTPFSMMLDFQSGVLSPYTSRVERHVSDLCGAFVDSAAAEALISDGDPVVYEVLQYDVPKKTGQLICCTTVLQPGCVGEEYFMTKGHYHQVRDTAEVYLGLSGEGYLLLMTEDGHASAIPMAPGIVAYVPPYWAHRTANTGAEPFVFFAVYPGQAGHDYGASEKSGFAQSLWRSAEGPVLR
jgi:glucose-6-phosphate isomerase